MLVCVHLKVAAETSLQGNIDVSFTADSTPFLTKLNLLKVRFDPYRNRLSESTQQQMRGSLNKANSVPIAHAFNEN